MFEAHPRPEREQPRAVAPDGAAGDLDDPRIAVVDAQLGVHRALGQAVGGASCAYPLGRERLDRFRQPRRRDVDRLFEEGAVERVRLVEDREHGQRSARQHAFEGDLRPRDERLDEQRAVLRYAALLGAGGRIGQDAGGRDARPSGGCAPTPGAPGRIGRDAGGRDARGGGNRIGGSADDRPGTPARGFETREVVRPDHPPARGHRERLDHAGKFDAVELGTDGTAQVHLPHRRYRKPGRRERGAGQILAAGGSRGGRGVVREPQGGGDAVRDLDGAVVGGDDGRDGPVPVRGQDPIDDRSGIRQIDPEPAGELRRQRVLPFARHEHLEAELASRLQVGVDPVAARRGDQQDPGRAPCRSLTGAPGPHRRTGRSTGPGPARRPIRVRRRQPQPPPPPPPAMPHAPQVPAPPVAWNTLLNTKVEPVSRVTKSIWTPLR